MHFGDCKRRRMMWLLHLLHAAKHLGAAAMVSASAVRLSLMTDLSIQQDLWCSGSSLGMHWQTQGLYNDFAPSIRRSLTGRCRLMADCVHLLDTEDHWECHVNVSWKSWIRCSFSSDREAGVCMEHRKARSPVSNEVTNRTNRSGRSMNKALAARLKTRQTAATMKRDRKRSARLPSAISLPARHRC